MNFNHVKPLLSLNKLPKTVTCQYSDTLLSGVVLILKNSQNPAFERFYIMNQKRGFLSVLLATPLDTKNWIKVNEQAAVKYLGGEAGANTMPPPPVVPPNVITVGLPFNSASVDVDGSTLDYLPLALYCNQSDCSWEITDISYPLIGIMTTSGNVVQPKYKVNSNQGSLLFILMIDPQSDLVIGTSIRQTNYWERLTQSWVPAETPHTTTIAVTSGITETDGETMSFTIGAKVGFNQKGILGELSASLTESFSSQVSITEQTTVTDQFQFPEKTVQQVDGVYQLIQAFTVYPGPNLTNYVTEMNEAYKQVCEQMHLFCSTYKVEMPFTYPTPSYLQIVGTDATNVGVMKFPLSPDEIKALARKSIKTHL